MPHIQGTIDNAETPDAFETARSAYFNEKRQRKELADAISTLWPLLPHDELGRLTDRTHRTAYLTIRRHIE